MNKKNYSNLFLNLSMLNKHVWGVVVLHAYRHYITAMYLPQSIGCQASHSLESSPAPRSTFYPLTVAWQIEVLTRLCEISLHPEKHSSRRFQQ